MAVSRADLKFRRQLVVPAQREIFDYWVSRRGRRLMPRRENIHPRGFVRHLSSVSLVEVERRTFRFRIRVAGTHLREIYGKELTGQYVDEVPALDDAPYKQMLERPAPLHGVKPVTTYNGGELIQFWLKLPLTENGRGVRKILCYDAYLRAAKALALTKEYRTALAS